MLGAGMTALCKGKYASAHDVALTCHMFDVVDARLSSTKSTWTP